MESRFKKYTSLRAKIDRLSHQLFDLHHSQIQCKKGCDLCCMDYSIFPIEFFYIKSKLKNTELPAFDEKDKSGSCVFLKNHECTIYEHRPIICRTHGLPLLYMNNESEEWELSACDLNFTNFEDFDDANTFPQDKFNSRLFLLNEEFIGLEAMPNFGKFDLIPIRELLSS